MSQLFRKCIIITVVYLAFIQQTIYPSEPNPEPIKGLSRMHSPSRKTSRLDELEEDTVAQQRFQQKRAMQLAEHARDVIATFITSCIKGGRQQQSLNARSKES